MIHFVCTNCSRKFQVKPEFGGRSTRCPTCKQALVVPDATAITAGGAIPGSLDGTAAGPDPCAVRQGITLAGTLLHDGQQSVQQLLSRRTRKGERYIIEGEIARGGMGAVARAVDCDIRREVAVKYLLDQTNASKKLRFVDEAQITGQLEHPHIVPIHELGADADGRLYFTMKMVKGRSLAQVLDERRETSAGRGVAQYTLSRLLTILVNVCHALAYAHARGVVHRDLKPANIMVGDFGEVYVMDWGLAKVVQEGPGIRHQASQLGTQRSGPGAKVVMEPAFARVAAFARAAPSQLDAATGDWAVTLGDSAVLAASSPERMSHDGVVTDRLLQADMTQDGAILGTPVYMPPEQAKGRIDAIDRRSDIYALGAILYEILTLQPPVAKEGGAPAILERVAKGDIIPPRRRVRQAGSKQRIPAELEAMALKALARDPAQRYQTVALFRQDIERFLDGRSVSAKDDSTHEMLVKLIKRNKGLSAGVAVAFLLLVVSLAFISQAWLATNEAYADAQREQDAKNKKGQKLVPAFVRAARLMANEKRFADAMAQVDVALRFHADDAEARLLRGQLWLSEQRYEDAEKELDECLGLRPGWEPAKKLAELCRQIRRDQAQAPAVAAELARQKAYTLAARLSDLAGETPTVSGTGQPLLTNSIGMQLARIPEGTFLMGSSAEEIERRKQDRPQWVPLDLIVFEGPRHGVRFTRPFYMGVHEVTVGQFRRFVEATGYKTQAEKDQAKNHWLKPGFKTVVERWHSLNKRSDKTVWRNPDFEQTDEHPVVFVNWHDATAFCDWLSAKESKGYRLPTEAEWEYACRAGTTTAYWCGDDPSALNEIGNIGAQSGLEIREYAIPPQRWYTTPVGRFKPNAFGLYDMHGNVWEWVADRYARDAYAHAPLDEPTGPVAGNERIFRGGSWLCQPYHGWTCRAAYRQPSAPSAYASHVGFRVVLDQADKARSAQQWLATYRTRLQESWPGMGKRLTADRAGKFTLVLAGLGDKVRDLVPLQAIPLSSLNLADCERVRYLTALKGMPLTELDLSGTQVADLTPLEGMPLTWLKLSGCTRVKDLTPLRGMKLVHLDLSGCDVQDIGPLKGMPLTSFQANSTRVQDLTPLKGMKLTNLSLRNANQVRDLTSLRSMPLVHLDLGWSPKMQGLEPLTGMKPTFLALPPSTTQQELSLVAKMPVTFLDIGSCSQIRDFSPILGLKLTHLGLPVTTTDKDLISLTPLPLRSLDLGVCRQVRDLTPLRGTKITFLAFWGASVTDLSPLEGMQLEHIRIPPPGPATKGLDVLRRMKSLSTIGVRWDAAMIWPAAEFWRKVEAGHFE
jgi:formylglycine-generating enzyme required for sulfatase activity/serine/threonine protein kinase